MKTENKQTVKMVKKGQRFTLETNTGKATFVMGDKRHAKCEESEGRIMEEGFLKVGEDYKLRPRLFITIL